LRRKVASGRHQRAFADAEGHGGRISDIAFDCGFNDLSYFNRCFRRRFDAVGGAGR
jgi:AraC-like DNA-binding protein